MAKRVGIKIRYSPPKKKEHAVLGKRRLNTFKMRPDTEPLCEMIPHFEHCIGIRLCHNKLSTFNVFFSFLFFISNSLFYFIFGKVFWLVCRLVCVCQCVCVYVCRCVFVCHPFFFLFHRRCSAFQWRCRFCSVSPCVYFQVICKLNKCAMQCFIHNYTIFNQIYNSYTYLYYTLLLIPRMAEPILFFNLKPTNR